MNKKNSMLIKNGRLMDPENNRDNYADILVTDGKVADIDMYIDEKEHEDIDIIDAEGCIIAPGLIDIHTHFRDPGQTEKEDISTGCGAAARGGFTTVCCMPNTSPPIDDLDILQYVDEKGREQRSVNLLATGAMTDSQEGLKISNIGKMNDVGTRCAEITGHGICAVSDDGSTVADADLMKRICLLAVEIELPVMDHVENAETVRRDISVAAETGVKMHLQHINTKECVDLIRDAKKQGIGITAETAPHYFTFTSQELERQAGNAKMNPPLGTEEDRAAVLVGLIDGTIDLIATDHAPHTEAEKALDINIAPFGVIGLETSLQVCHRMLVAGGHMTMFDLIRLMSLNPAKVIDAKRGSLGIGDVADIVMIEEKPCRIDKNEFVSKGRNTPFDGMDVNVRVKRTIAEGRTVYSET